MEVSKFEDDLLGLREFADRLEKFIKVEQRYVEGSLVIALSSKFGSGKTTFLRMWKSSLESDDNQDSKPLVVFLNAWESDYFGDPLFAIISSLIKSTESKDENANELKEAAKNIGWFATAVGGQIAKKATGIDPAAAGAYAEGKSAKRDAKNLLVPDSFSQYEDRKNAMDSLKNAIREFVASTANGVLFLVDELDRCRPDYAISYLETIKHIFDAEGATFLLAADRQQLENSAKAAFGSDLDFDEYYRKFIHREVTLPEISASNYEKIASKYVAYYLEGEGSRHCYLNMEEYDTKRDLSKLIEALKLTPRQIQEAFRILGHICETPKDHDQSTQNFFATGSIFMSVLKVGSPKYFHLIGERELTPDQTAEFLNTIFSDKDIEHWFLFLWSGGALKTDQNANAEALLKQVGIREDDGKTSQTTGHANLLGRYHNAWGHTSDGLVRAYEKIEQLSQWIKQ